jgi:hypothetical protein
MIDGLGNRGPISPTRPHPQDGPYTVCKRCGCTANDACLTDGVPCTWANAYLCTRCVALGPQGAANAEA